MARNRNPARVLADVDYTSRLIGLYLTEGDGLTPIAAGITVEEATELREVLAQEVPPEHQDRVMVNITQGGNNTRTHLTGTQRAQAVERLDWAIHVATRQPSGKSPQVRVLPPPGANHTLAGYVLPMAQHIA